MVGTDFFSSIIDNYDCCSSPIDSFQRFQCTFWWVDIKTYSKWIWKSCSQFFVISNCWVGLCFSYPSYLNMWLLKSSKKIDQIIIMRWINQAYTQGLKTWVWLINIKKGHNIQSFYSKCRKNQANNGLKRCMSKQNITQMISI